MSPRRSRSRSTPTGASPASTFPAIPGITATLYNVGNPEQRAYALKAENDKRRAAARPEKLPEENYYGWLVNDKLPELKALF